MADELVNSPHQRPRRWRRASLIWNASRGFSDPREPRVPPDVSPHQVHVSDQKGAERTDLEANSPPAAPTASAFVRLLPRSVLVVQIRRILQLVTAVFFQGTPQNQLEQQHKRCSKYSQKALLFAITTLVSYLRSTSSSPSTGNITFKIAMAGFIVAIPMHLISATRTPKWGWALVYLSWFLLVLLSYLLLVSFHKDYSYAIIPVALLVFAALLQCKLRLAVRQESTTNIAEPSQHPNSNNEADRDLGTEDNADQDLENIFDWSAGIVNCGGLISVVLGQYKHVAGHNHQHTAASIIGFLFFFTVVLGLYLMMVTTVRTPALILYISYVAYLLDVLLVGTFIAIFIHGSWALKN
ncbi:unnamed protein product [Urochloa humidicola]